MMLLNKIYWSTADILTSIWFLFQHCSVFAYMQFSLYQTFVYRTSFYWCTKLWEITSRLHLKMCIIISDNWRCIHNHWWLRMSIIQSDGFRSCQEYKTSKQQKSVICIEREFSKNILFFEVYVYILSFFFE